jgi:hypothetical protein
MAKATLWTASSAIFAGIATVADTTAKSVETLASSIHMVDSYVHLAREKQQANQLIERENYRENLILDSTLEQGKREQVYARELANDPDLKARATAIESRYRALLAPTPATTP